jgi:hypothetical protein
MLTTPPPDSEESFEQSNLTRSQLLFWAGQRLQPEAPLYNMVGLYTISSKVEYVHLKSAFQTLVNSSDALRTTIEERAGTPFLKVLSWLDCALEYVDCSRAADPERELSVWVDERRRIRFDMTKRLFDCALLKISDEKFACYINNHQLIGDAWAGYLIHQRLSELYALSREGRLGEKVELPAFHAYMEYEREVRRSTRYRKAEAYWKGKLREPLEPLCLYGSEPLMQTVRGARTPCQLDAGRMRRLRELSQREGVFVGTPDLSLFIIFATLLFVYLHRVSGNRRLSLGVMHHNRVTKAFAETIGMFMEVLPLRIEIEEGDTFKTLTRKVAAEALESFKNVQYTTGNPIRHKSYQATLNYINAPLCAFDGTEVEAEWVHAGYQNEILDLNVRQFNPQGDWILEFDFDFDLFNADEQLDAVEHFLRILDALLEDLDCPVERPGMLLSESRKRQMQALEMEARLDFAWAGKSA